MTLSREDRKALRDRHREANDAVYQRELATARAYKQRQRGTCERCGGSTRYNGKDGKSVGRWCHACQAQRGKEYQQARRGTGPLQLQTLGLLTSGPKRFTEIRDALGVTNNHVVVHLNRMVRYGLIIRVERGLYRLA